MPHPRSPTESVLWGLERELTANLELTWLIIERLEMESDTQREVIWGRETELKKTRKDENAQKREGEGKRKREWESKLIKEGACFESPLASKQTLTHERAKVSCCWHCHCGLLTFVPSLSTRRQHRRQPLFLTLHKVSYCTLLLRRIPTFSFSFSSFWKSVAAQCVLALVVFEQCSAQNPYWW